MTVLDPPTTAAVPPQRARLAAAGAAAVWVLVGLAAGTHGFGLRPAGLTVGIVDGPGLAAELALLGLLTWLAVSLRHARPTVERVRLRGLLLAATGVVVALVLITGGATPGPATASFPTALTLTHWAFAGAALPIVLAATWLARPAGRGATGPAFELATTGAALYVIELLVGAAGAFGGPQPWARPVHLLLGAAVLACFVGSAAQVATGAGLGSASSSLAVAPLAPLARSGSVDRRAARVRGLRAYVALTKPRIIELLLVTTVPAMVLAAPQAPGLRPGSWALLVLWTLIGGTLAAGSANAINQYIDRDIDARMTRTRRRPLPDSVLDPQQVLLFSLALGVLAFALLLITTNLLAAVLTLVANAFYVVVYTLLLKRTTVQNIVIGGAAGALPPMIGWAAVTGGLAPAPILLFLIVFFWTPPHFWALALRLKDDYAAAGVPMLPVVRGVAETDRQILLYAIAVVGLTLLLVPVAGMGLLYLAAAAGLGVVFLRQAVILWRDGTAGPAMRLYRGSITYLAGVFGAVALDVLIRVRP